MSWRSNYWPAFCSRSAQRRRVIEPPGPRQGGDVAQRAAAVRQFLTAIADGFAGQPLDDLFGQPLRKAAAAPQLASASACGRLLADAGLLDQAEAIFAGVASAFPEQSAGPAGLASVAMRREGWVRALDLWADVAARFIGPALPQWESARALALANLGHADDALAICFGLIETLPDHPAGYAGLAQLAMRDGDWAVAEARWNDVIARSPGDEPTPATRVSRAAVLLRLGRVPVCEQTVREVLSTSPTLLSALVLLLRSLVAGGRPAEALNELAASPLAAVESAPLLEMRLEALIRLRQLNEARRLFSDHLERGRTTDWLETLLAYAVRLYEGRRRTSVWSLLLVRAETLIATAGPDDARRASVLQARLLLALRDHQGFSAAIDSLERHGYSGRHAKALRGVAAAIRDPRYPDFQKPKIFGIGLSKTGTTSLAAALTLLGFNTLDWANPLTGELLSDDELFQFDALTDIMASNSFERYYYMFPRSKFIYTLRDPVTWKTAIEAQWRRIHGLENFAAIKRAVEKPGGLHQGAPFRTITAALYTNHESFQHAFLAHHERVSKFFSDKPPDRFLELDLFKGDGWNELCGFLGLEAPTRPFPRENRRPDLAGA
jgi:tetratricopeptide (TPR) repeat protein